MNYTTATDYTKADINKYLEAITEDVARFGLEGDRLTVRAADDKLNYLFFIRDEINAQIKATKAAAKKAAKV